MIWFNGNSLVTINAIEADIQTMRVVDFYRMFEVFIGSLKVFVNFIEYDYQKAFFSWYWR